MLGIYSSKKLLKCVLFLQEEHSMIKNTQSEDISKKTFFFFLLVAKFSLLNKALFSLTAIYIFLTHSMYLSCMTDFLEIDSAHAGLFASSSICWAVTR